MTTRKPKPSEDAISYETAVATLRHLDKAKTDAEFERLSELIDLADAIERKPNGLKILRWLAQQTDETLRGEEPFRSARV